MCYNLICLGGDNLSEKTVKHVEWIISLFLLIVTIYQSIIGKSLFFLVSSIFLSETIVYFLAAINKQTLKVSSVIQFFHSPLVMVVLLLSIFLNGEANHLPITFITIGLCLIVKAVIVNYYYAKYKNDNLNNNYSNNYVIYARIYNGLTSLLYLINLLVVCITKNIIKDDTIVILFIIMILINAISTFFVAFFSLSFLITAFIERVLSFKEKIIAVSKFFVVHDLGFIVGEMFSLMASIVCFINISKSDFFSILWLFYTLFFTVKLVEFIWVKKIGKKYSDTLIISKKKNKILLFNSIVFFVSSDLLSSTLALLSSLKFSSTIPVWFFVGFMFPFSILNIVLCLIHRRGARHHDDAYMDATADQTLITSLISLLAGISYFFKFFNTESLADTIWVSLSGLVMLIINASLVYSFVRAIRGLGGRRKVQKSIR